MTRFKQTYQRDKGMSRGLNLSKNTTPSILIKLHLHVTFHITELTRLPVPKHSKTPHTAPYFLALHSFEPQAGRTETK